MGDISTERKMELIRSIRNEEQNNYERIRKREGILYSNQSYGYPDHYREPQDEKIFSESFAAYKKESGALSFRLRMIISILLFLLFFFMDIKQHDFYSISSTDIKEAIGETFTLNSFDFITQLPYTLEE